MTPAPKHISWCVQALMLALIMILSWISRDSDPISYVPPAFGFAAYALAYWILLPELRGREAGARPPFAKRWAKLTAFIGIPFAGWNIAWIGIAVGERSLSLKSLSVGMLMALLLAVLPICFFAAAQRYATRADGRWPGTPNERGLVSHFARILLRLDRLIPAGAALVAGCLLVLASLLLSMDASGWDFGSLGYQVVLGRHGWPTDLYGTAHFTGIDRFWDAGRFAYRLAIGFSLLTVILLFAGSGRGRRGSNALARVVLAVVAYLLLQHILCDSILYAATDGGYRLEVAAFYIAGGYAFGPLLLWWHHRTRGEERLRRWPSTCLALQLAFVPFLFFMLVTFYLALAFEVDGYIAYFAGVALLWWGYAQLLIDAAPTTAG